MLIYSELDSFAFSVCYYFFANAFGEIMYFKVIPTEDEEHLNHTSSKNTNVLVTVTDEHR